MFVVCAPGCAYPCMRVWCYFFIFFIGDLMDPANVTVHCVMCVVSDGHGGTAMDQCIWCSFFQC